MNDERHNIIAFGMLLFAICYLATIAAILAYAGKYAEALGFGGLTTGLVGVIGTFRPKTIAPAATVGTAESVNVTPAPPEQTS